MKPSPFPALFKAAMMAMYDAGVDRDGSTRSSQARANRVVAYVHGLEAAVAEWVHAENGLAAHHQLFRNPPDRLDEAYIRYAAACDALRAAIGASK